MTHKNPNTLKWETTIGVIFLTQISQMLQIILFTDMFAKRFQQVRIMKTLPIFSRIFQVADFVCTMRRLAFKLQINGKLAKSETLFFGSVGNFRKIWLKPLLKCEWL